MCLNFFASLVIRENQIKIGMILAEFQSLTIPQLVKMQVTVQTDSSEVAHNINNKI
jgi:hypothetical protein